MDADYSVSVFIITKYKLLVLWSAIITAGLYLLLKFLTNFNIEWYYDYIIIILLLVTLLISINLIVRFLLKKINEILLENCDPEKYCKIYLDIIAQLSKIREQPDISLYRLNLSSGLLASGKYEDAINELDKCSSILTKKRSLLVRCTYYSNLFTASLSLGQIDDARKHLDNLIENTAKLKPKSQKEYDVIMMYAQFRYNIAIGIYDFAEKAFIKAFNKAKNISRGVSAKFWLGKVFLHNGNLEGAREAFNYVIYNGNKLHDAQEAKALLGSIERNN